MRTELFGTITTPSSSARRAATAKRNEQLGTVKLPSGSARSHGQYILKNDIDLLEGVQRRATNMILGYKHYCYKHRLVLCQLSTLEGRRLRGDLIQAFKLLKGLDQINYSDYYHCTVKITFFIIFTGVAWRHMTA